MRIGVVKDESLFYRQEEEGAALICAHRVWFYSQSTPVFILILCKTSLRKLFCAPLKKVVKDGYEGCLLVRGCL